MKDKKIEMGLITHIHFGWVDNQGVGLLMEVRILTGIAQLFVPAEAAIQVLTDLKLGSVEKLKGAPCVVSVDDDKIVRFERLL